MTPQDGQHDDHTSDEDGADPGQPHPAGGSGATSTPPVDGGPDPNVGKGLLDVDMGPSSALAHLYRGEVHRMKFWRERLDRTTNWAVIVLGGILTYAFSTQANPHYVILIGNAAIGLFLIIEARRYRAYDLWRSRVRSLQENVWATGLDASSPTDGAWREELAEDYRNPALKITAEEAIAHRLRRVYLPMFAILNGAWVARVTAFGGESWPESAAVGQIPGLAVTAAVVVLFAAGVVIACRPRNWQARGELRTENIRDGQPRETRSD
jgi:uncharacterized membrane protein